MHMYGITFVHLTVDYIKVPFGIEVLGRIYCLKFNVVIHHMRELADRNTNITKDKRSYEKNVLIER